MPLTPAFTISNTLSTPSTLLFTDTSSGSDAAITSRRIFIQTNDGTYLVPSGILTSYIPLAYASSTKSVNVLTRDFSLSILVQWLNVSDAVLYTSSDTFVFTVYSENFYYSLTEAQAADPSILNDKDYWYNKLTLRVQIDDSENAVAIGGDISSAQQALDRAVYMMERETSYF